LHRYDTKSFDPLARRIFERQLAAHKPAADAARRHELLWHGPLASVRLIAAGALGRLHEAALTAQGLDVTAVDGEQASRLGLGTARIGI
jgi:hypothetical protein